MKRFSSDAHLLAFSESRKRSRPNDFHGTDHKVERLHLVASTESFIDKNQVVPNALSAEWMQNGLERKTHAWGSSPDIEVDVENTAMKWPALSDPAVSSRHLDSGLKIGVTNDAIQQNLEPWSFHNGSIYTLENNLSNLQTDLEEKALNGSDFQDSAFSSLPLHPEIDIRVAHEPMQEEKESWLFNSEAGNFNTSTESSYRKPEYEDAPFGHYTTFNNNPLKVEVTGIDGSWGSNLHPFTFDDADYSSFSFPPQPATDWPDIPVSGLPIDETNSLSPFPLYLKSETSYESTSNVSFESSPAVTEAQGCSESVGPSATNSHPDPGASTISEDIKYDAVSLPSDPDRPIAECDLCFGVIMTTLISSIESTNESSVLPLDVEIFGTFVKLTVQHTKKYAGILNYSVLCVLLKDFNVRLSATLTTLESLPSEGSDNKKAKPNKNHTVRIVVYGTEKENLITGNLLSEADLFLQHPTDAECGRHRKYVNPHYLLRPGAEMPKLEHLSLTADARSTTRSERSDEVDLARISRIFDCAEPGVEDVATEPSPRLKSTLMSHQLTALALMIERESRSQDNLKFPSLWITATPNKKASVKYRHIVTGIMESHPVPTYGGVLADEMGLGKTLSILALVCSTLDFIDKQKLEFSDSLQRTTLIIAPKSTIAGWEMQISRHIHRGKIRFVVYHGSGREKLATQLHNYDIVITTYDTFRSDWTTGGALYSGQWLRVILDEAHHIRNRSSQIFKAALEIRSMYRWCLTGTPIHNSIDDYGALLSFIGVEPFHEKSSFDHWIVSPLKENRPGSLQLLRNLVQATCLRRTKTSPSVSLDLEKYIEETEQVQLHQEDQRLYDFFQKKTADIAAGLHCMDKGKPRRKSSKDENILCLMNFLRAICNHGTDLLPSRAVSAWENPDVSQVDWKMMQASQTTCNQCGQECVAKQTASTPRSPNEAYSIDVCDDCAAARDEESDHTQSSPEDTSLLLTAGVSKPSRSADFTRPSAKVVCLLKNLQREQRENVLGKPKKSVIFSYSTKMLDLIERELNFHGFRFQRIDGQGTLKNRYDALRQFNDVSECTVMLASIGSCGEGIDFTAANYVHLVEPHWNPMVEAQAIDRVHRKGQTRLVTVTRYIVPNSIETYIQWVQTQKLKLINQSLDDTVDRESLEMERWKQLEKFLKL